MIVVNACAARVRLCRRLQATRLCVCVTATGIFCVFTCFSAHLLFFSTSSLSFLRIGTVFLLFHVFQRIQVLSFYQVLTFLYGSSFFCTFTRFSTCSMCYLRICTFLSGSISPHLLVPCHLNVFIPAPCFHMFSSHFRLFRVFESFCNIFCSLYVTQLVIVISGISFRSR